MLFKGFKIRVRCVDWEQVNTIGNFWQSIKDFVSYEDVVGLGMNWSDDYLYFDYAIGVIDNDIILEKLKNISFSQYGFDANYFEIELPNSNEWVSFEGKDEEVRELYENSIDCYNKEYDYELEYLDGEGNIEIKIHFINN